MTSKHSALLKAFKKINTVYADKVKHAEPLIGEKHATLDGVAIKITMHDGTWLRVYRIANGELNWY